MYLVVGVIWVVVAAIFFFQGEYLISIPWLVIGLFNFFRYYWKKKLENAEKINRNHFSGLRSQSNTIILSGEKHRIGDENDRFSYSIDKSFQNTKSHAAEVENLAVYAPQSKDWKEGDVPDNEWTEADIPSIYVLTDDLIYESIEQYKNGNTDLGVIQVDAPLNETFLFAAKTGEYGHMTVFYAFQVEYDDYTDNLGLCLSYPKEYAGKAEEMILLAEFVDVAKSFKFHEGRPIV